MKINRPQANALVLHTLVPLPLFLGSGLGAYLVLFWIIFSSGRVRNFLLLAGAAIAAFLLVRASPLHADLTSQMQANSLNATTSTLLILLSPLFRLKFRYSPSRYADISIIAFLVIGLALTHLANAPGALLQIGSFSIALYMFTADTRLRQLLGASSAVFAGARILILGLVLGWAVVRGRRLVRMIILPTLVIAAYFLLRADTFGDIRSFLEELRANGNLMKGRTVYWLTLTANEATLFGNGAGNALLLVEDRIGYFQLPHNEYLRVISDYGAIPLLALIIVLARNATSKEAHKRFGTVLLAFYMLTGNPLSFPTVIVSYLLIMNSDIVRRGRQIPDGQYAMGAPAPPAP